MGSIKTLFPKGWAPKPTVIKDFHKRLLECFEATRAANKNGYNAGAWVKQIHGPGGWWGNSKLVNGASSCTPWTGTVIGMLLDPDSPPTGEAFHPKFDGGDSALPFVFYMFHNTSYEGSHAEMQQWFLENNWITHLTRGDSAHSYSKPGTAHPYDSAGSIPHFNLGYEIDPRDLRRGDLVGMNWAAGGHAGFVWDVHLDPSGAVDAYTYVSCNGHKHFAQVVKNGELQFNEKDGKKYPVYGWDGTFDGSGVSCSYIFTEPQARPAPFKATQVPLFLDKFDEYITKAQWLVLPMFGYSAKSIRATKSWKKVPGVVDDDSLKYVSCARFWGVAPPDKSTPRGAIAWSDGIYSLKFEQAKSLQLATPPEPYCMGDQSGLSLTAQKVKPTKVPAEKAKKPEEVKKTPTTPVVQKPENVAPQQHLIETMLSELFHAGWIDKDPGDSGNVNDKKTFDAVWDFQQKWGLHVDGGVGDETMPALSEAWVALRGLQLVVNRPPRPTSLPLMKHKSTVVVTPLPQPVPPDIKKFYLLDNHASPRGRVHFAIEGEALNNAGTIGSTITLVEPISETEFKLSTPLDFKNPKRFEGSFVLPPSTPSGTWKPTLDCKYASTHLVMDSSINLNVSEAPPDEPKVGAAVGWPWDETQWPKLMRDIVAELRTTERPSPPFAAQWFLTTYGVKERMNAVGPLNKKQKPIYPDGGDMVQLLEGDNAKNPTGKVLGEITKYSLWQADIEGTMRFKDRTLNISKTGRPNSGSAEIVDGKKRHIFEHFDPTQSLWIDVTDAQPWGGGVVMPLIPFRVLAINGGSSDKSLYYKKVYIHALDGVKLVPSGEIHNGICVIGDSGDMDPGQQFDFFKGREDVPFAIDDGIGTIVSKSGTPFPASQVVILDACKAALPANRKARRKK